jgi:hypothetical protein
MCRENKTQILFQICLLQQKTKSYSPFGTDAEDLISKPRAQIPSSSRCVVGAQLNPSRARAWWLIGALSEFGHSASSLLSWKQHSPCCLCSHLCLRFLGFAEFVLGFAVWTIPLCSSRYSIPAASRQDYFTIKLQAAACESGIQAVDVSQGVNEAQTLCKLLCKMPVKELLLQVTYCRWATLAASMFCSVADARVDDVTHHLIMKYGERWEKLCLGIKKLILSTVLMSCELFLLYIRTYQPGQRAPGSSREKLQLNDSALQFCARNIKLCASGWIWVVPMWLSGYCFYVYIIIARRRLNRDRDREAESNKLNLIITCLLLVVVYHVHCVCRWLDSVQYSESLFSNA